MSWLAQFPVREIIFHNRTKCKRYFPIGNVQCGWGVIWPAISRSGNGGDLDSKLTPIYTPCGAVFRTAPRPLLCGEWISANYRLAHVRNSAFMDRIHAFLPGWDVPKINKDLLTNHFGLVSDFLSECWSQLRNQSRVSELQNRVFFGRALSGRDTNAVNKTVSGLLKLLYPSSDTPVPDEDLEFEGNPLRRIA
jgi:hypothetical protein